MVGIKRNMEKWKTELSVNGEMPGAVDIKRGIFKGDCLSWI